MYGCPSCTYFFTTPEAVIEHKRAGGECDQRKACLKQWNKDFAKKYPALKPKKGKKK
jgi:hypothetical protein